MDFLHSSISKSRPMALLAGPLILGIVLFESSRVILPLFLQIVIVVVFVSGFVLFRFSTLIRLFFLMMFVFFVGWIRTQYFNERFESQPLHTILDTHRHCQLVGRIITAPESRGERSRAVVRVKWVIIDQQYRRLTGNILMNWPKENGQVGQDDIIVATGTLSRPDGQRNPGEFNYRSYLMRREVAGLFYVRPKDPLKALEKGPGKSVMTILFGNPRIYIERLFDRYLTDGISTGLLKGLILGQKGEILPETRTAFADAGVVHVLAVSGLHVGFVAMFLFLIVNVARAPAKWKPVLISIGLVYFAGLTGFKPPVVRAVTMAILFLFGRLLQQKTDIYNILLTAALFILIITPYSLYEPGFQLSFTAVFGIAFFYSRFSKQFEFKEKIKSKGAGRVISWVFDLMLVSLSAQIGTLPLTMIYFEQIPLLAIFANLVVVPLVQIIVILGFVLIVISFLWEQLPGVLGAIVSLLLGFLSDFVSWIASFSFAKIDTAQFSAIEILVLFTSLSIIFWLVLKRRYGLILTGILLAVVLKIWFFSNDGRSIEITFLDVGQGDAALIKSSEFSLLVDSGPWTTSYDAGSRTIGPYLRRNGIDTIDAVFNSHPHADHIGGLASLLKAFNVKEVFAVDPGEKVPFPDYRPICDSLGVKLTYVTAGDTLTRFRPLKISVLSPLKFMLEGESFDTNNRSMVLLIKHGKNRLMFGGDVEHESEDILGELGPLLKADLLKVAHHGSITSSTQRFIAEVSPRIVIIPVGKFNRFGHPSQEVLNRFNKMKAEIFRTDSHGAVSLRSDGIELELIR